MEKTNTMNNQTQLLIQKGAQIYNTLRDSQILFYGKALTIEDKKNLAMYLTIIEGDNFYVSILKKLGYSNFIKVETFGVDSQKYDKEFYASFQSFATVGNLGLLVLYLLDCSIIKEINTKKGNQNWALKIGVYDYLNETIRTTGQIQNNKNKQKVLTK